MAYFKRKFTILLLLLAAVAVAASWWAFRNHFPNTFDRKTVDTAEVQQLASVDLSQKNQRDPSVNVGQEWPQFLGPFRNGWVSPVGFRTNWNEKPPQQLWTAPCGGGFASCCVTGGKLYTHDKLEDQERVLCLNAETGAVLWQHAYAVDYSGMKKGYANGPRATPAVHDGRIYALGATGKLLCLLEPTSPGSPPAVAWEKDLVAEFRARSPEWGIASSPLIEGDTVIVQPGARGASVVAFDRKTGETRWKTGDDLSGYSSPVAATLGGVRQIVAVTGQSVLGLRANDGTELWRYPWKTQFEGNVASPVIVGDYVFVSSAYNKGCALLHVASASADRVNMKPVYFLPNELMRTHHNTVMHKDGFLYGYDDQVLRCIDMREQTNVFEWAGSDHADISKTKGTLILVGDHLVGLTQKGTLFLAEANPKELKVLGKIEKALSGSECWAVPVVVRGRIYIRDQSTIVCYDAKE